tara:strand:- start:1079 stop:5077 length:3999 start_codon:yes stop_codon:yes gene_type:complete
MPRDTQYIDTARIDETIAGSEERTLELDEQKRKAEADRIAEEAEAERRQEELEKGSHAVKDPSEFGLSENVTELKNAIVGGGRDTLSSFVTLPERVVDIASGEMVDDIKYTGDYEPDFNPLGGDLNPETKTWWGQFIRTGVHFGTMAIPIVGWGGAAAKGTGAVSVLAKGTVASSNWLIKGASIGVAQDLISEYSQDSNGLQVLRDRFGFIDTPCTTKDTDHPAMKTAKSVCEGIGIGTALEGGMRAIGRVRSTKNIKSNPTNDVLKKVDKVQSNRIIKAEIAAQKLVHKNLEKATIQRLFNQGIDFKKLSKDEQTLAMLQTQKTDKSNRFSTWSPDTEGNIQRAERIIEDNKKSVDEQIIEKGQQELNDPDARGHKNKPIMAPHQGAPNSTGKPWNVLKTLKRIYNEWGAENGSTDNLITPAAAEVVADSGSGLKGLNDTIAKQLIGDARFDKLLQNLKAEGRTLQDVYSDAFERMQETIGGRDAGALTPEEFWKDIFEGIEDVDSYSIENVLAADLIQQSLFKQLRDRAVAARELIDHVNVDDVDGPLKYIRDNLIVGIEQTQRSRFFGSEEYKALALQKGGKKLVEQALSDIHAQAKQRVDMVFNLARQSPSDDLLRGMLEAFSMSNKISNWQDLDNYFRHKLLGHTTESGLRETGAIIKELQGVMINSILSGPKTAVRAMLGTGSATFLRPISQILGGAGRYITTGFTDASTLREGLAEINAMREVVPEAFEFFKHRLNGYWSGDISTVKSRYAEYTLDDEQWELLRFWAEDSGNASIGEKAAFRVANLARGLNHSNFLNYNMKLLASTDDAFTMILARARGRSRALRDTLDAKAQGLIPDIDKNIIREYEARVQNEIWDPATGNLNDNMLKYARGEVTLTKDLTGYGEALNKLFGSFPEIKPFYLFARTGINGLELTAKHTPFGMLLKEFNEIARATPDSLDKVVKYGIDNAQDLKNAQDLQNGRLLIGSAVMYQAGQKYMQGELTGNGPSDIQLRQAWISGGWVPRSIKLGDVWIGHESLEPFSTVLSAVADLGDNMNTIGPNAVEKGLLSHSLVIGKALISKTYLQGLTGLTDLFTNNPKKLERLAANLMNNQVPLAGLRNEIGKIINPHMKELNADLWQTIRNKNQFMEILAGEDDLPVKYDVLNGRPIKDWDFLTRMYNAVSPIQLNFDQSPGRKFLFRSQYDLNLATLTAPDGTSLAEVPGIRSKFQQALGKQDLETKLTKLSKRKEVIESIRLMEEDIKEGRHRMAPGISPMSYKHNQLIGQAFNQAKIKAWAMISSDPDVMQLIHARKKAEAAAFNRTNRPEQSRKQYDEANQLLQLNNK